MIKITLFMFALFALSTSGASAQKPVLTSYDDFLKAFIQPPGQAWPTTYHWWLGGNVDTLRLKDEIRSMKKAGISGFTIFEIGSRDTLMVKPGPPFLGEESLAAIKCAVTEAGKLGMEVGLNTASSWNAGGHWVTPEHAAKSIYCSRTKVRGPSTQTLKIPFPEIPKTDPWGKPRLINYLKNGKPEFYLDVAVLALPASKPGVPLDTGSIVNVTRFFNPGSETLRWIAPHGEWEILRFVCSNSGENLVLPSKHSAGPIMDHYDADATEFHFMYIIKRLKTVLGNFSETALKSLYMASYEAKGFTWTTSLPETFLEINGYPIAKLLPVLFDANLFSPELTARFKADYQRTLSELMINNFYKKSKEICNRYGLKNNCEAGGPGLPLHNVPVEPLKALGALDIPRGEFWINHSRWNEQGIDILRVVKEVSAASHIYHKGIVEMEAFTTFQHWQEGPFEMKPSGDRAFCEGMNKVVVHGSTHNPAGTGYPGIVYGAGTHFNDKRVWWSKVRPFNEYLARVSSILQKADFFADVLYYYGDTIPNWGGHKNSRFIVGPGYDFEIVNTEILLELTVNEGKLVMPRTGASFSLLYLTEQYEMAPQVLVKLDELARQGAIILGKKPGMLVSRRDKAVFLTHQKLLDNLWAGQDGLNHRPGVVNSPLTPAEVLQNMDIGPDLDYPGSEAFLLDFIHYRKNGLDFYFIRNTSPSWVSRYCSFRQKNKVPELWCPVSGKVTAVGVFQEDQRGITVPLSFAPYESFFVVFKDGLPAQRISSIKTNGIHPPRLSFSDNGLVIWDEGVFELTRNGETGLFVNIPDVKTLAGPWEVSFTKGWGAPEKTVFPELISWTGSEEPGIRYFSGIATYTKRFICDINSNTSANPLVYLDLGDLSHVAEVWLNNQPLGVAWAKPYRFDISNLIRTGENTLVVEVANTWSNRLVGDAQTGEKFTSTNIQVTDINGAVNLRLPWKEVPLIKSGLFGPVTITYVSSITE